MDRRLDERGFPPRYYPEWVEDEPATEAVDVAFVPSRPTPAFNVSGVCLQIMGSAVRLASSSDWLEIQGEFTPPAPCRNATTVDEKMDCWKTQADYDTMTLEFISYLHQDGYVPREFFTPLNGKDTVVELSYFRSEFVDDPDVARVDLSVSTSDVVRTRRDAAFFFRLWLTVPAPSVLVTEELKPTSPFEPFALFTTIFAIFTTTYNLFNGLVHHAPAKKRRFLPRLRNTEKELVAGVAEIAELESRRSRNVEAPARPEPAREETRAAPDDAPAPIRAPAAPSDDAGGWLCAASCLPGGAADAAADARV